MNKNTLRQCIDETYGSIDKMIAETDITISRPYLYQLINGSHKNPSKKVLVELSNILKLSIEELLELIDAEEI